MTSTRARFGVPAVVTALIGLAAGLLGSAVFSHWREPRAIAGQAPPPSVPSTGDGESAAALREIRALLARERRRSVTSTPDVAEATPPAIEEEPVAEEGAELSFEEQAAAHVEAHEAAIAEHGREPRDPSWAPRVEAGLLDDLNALPKLGGRIIELDCRTTTCLAEIEWENYSGALENYPKVLQGRYQTNCGTGTVLPAPSQPEATYRARFTFDCESSRTDE